MGATIHSDMKLICSLFALILATFGGFGAQVSGPVPYSRLTTNDFRIDAQGFVWLRLSPSITISNNVILVTTNMYVTNATIFINGTNVAVINPTDNYHAKRGGPTNLVDSTISDDGTTTTIHGTGQSVLQLETDDGQVVFGSGGTNKVYRTNGVDLEYWNPSYGLTLQPSFRVREGDGKYVGLGFDQIGGGLTLGSAATLTIGQSYLVTHNVYPYGAGYHVGTVNNSSQKYQYLAALTNYVVGFDDGAGNHSWLALYHGGTNDAIHFDSQSAGTAGPPRDFQFTNAVLRADATKGIELGGVTRTTWPSGLAINPTATAMPFNNTGTLGDSPLRVQSSERLGFNSSTVPWIWQGANDSLALGVRALENNVNTTDSIAIGGRAMGSSADAADYNVAIGASAGIDVEGVKNVFIGRHTSNLTNSYNVLVGSDIGVVGAVNSRGATNSISIGYAAPNLGTNTATMGNASVSVLYLGGEVGWFKGAGDPNSDAALDAAPLGSFYSNKSGGAGTTFYVKEAAGANGWFGK